MGQAQNQARVCFFLDHFTMFHRLPEYFHLYLYYVTPARVEETAEPENWRKKKKAKGVLLSGSITHPGPSRQPGVRATALAIG
jgi:hypothetical protein